MFKKGPDIDKKKLLAKASDVTKDSLTRLKHFKTLIEHLDHNETHSLFKSRFIYHTFIDTFSSFDSTSKQKRDDLECTLFIFEKIIQHNPELIKNQNTFSIVHEAGGTSFNDILQIFVLNSSNAFLTAVHNPSMLDEQFEMCKRIMNIYRYMVMKIYMNTPTWEQLLTVMIMITEQLFPSIPPERKESTIGGRIAPAFFQTFIVSWIRANLYVNISSQMWRKFHDVMSNLVRWRELVEEWASTMGSLTRVLVKHVYGLSLTDLPLERPQDRRRRPKTLKSFSTADTANNSPESLKAMATTTSASSQSYAHGHPRSGSVRLPCSDYRNMTSGLRRSNSDGAMVSNQKLYYSASLPLSSPLTLKKIRKIKSEYLIFASDLSAPIAIQSELPTTDALDGASLKNSMNIDHDHALDSHSGKTSIDLPGVSKSTSKRTDSRISSDKCVLLGGNIRGWTPESSIIMWRRMLGLFGNINHFEDPKIHHVAIKCLGAILDDFTKTRENLGISIDNQSTPDQPSLIPPYTYTFAWLLETTHLPRKFKESRLLAYKLLCSMLIRRHDIELSQQFYMAFYEALQRGLASNDLEVHASIIGSAVQLISLELPGCTLLVNSLYEKCQSILNDSEAEEKGPTNFVQNSRDQSVQILNIILTLHRPFKKLMVLRCENNNYTNLVAPIDWKSKIVDTLIACNTRPSTLNSQTRSKSLCSLAMHIYQDLCDKSETSSMDRFVDILLAELQHSNNSITFRMNCDLLRLLADHACVITNSRPTLVASIIQIVCQLVVKLSTDECNKECIHYLLICLEDWCLAVNKSFLTKPINQQSNVFDKTIGTICEDSNGSIISKVLETLESITLDEQSLISDSGSRASTRTIGSKNGVVDRSIHNKSSSSSGSQYDKTLSVDPQTSTKVQQESQPSEKLSAIKLACKVTHLKLLTYLGHFPLRQVGPATMSCCVDEMDYLTNNDQPDQADLKNDAAPLLLIVSDDTILSFFGSSMNKEGNHQPLHLMIRNLCGKYSWDLSCIEKTCLDLPKQMVVKEQEKDSIIYQTDSFQDLVSRSSMKYDSDYNDDGNSNSSLSSRSSSNRDCIGDLLNHLSQNSTIANCYPNLINQCAQRSKRNSTQSISNPKYKIAIAEETMIALLTNQRFQELNHSEKFHDNERVVFDIGPGSRMMSQNIPSQLQNFDKLNLNNYIDDPTYRKLITLEQCRRLAQQLGFLSWEKRCKIDSLAISQRLMRELKNLDNQPGRETHKIAVIYVAAGQEDKNSILINSNGSRAFEDFVAGLGWEVNLASHLGFRGGLQSNKSTGETSPYYCNGTTEVMFHVSTRIPINRPLDDESLNRKLRHLGNDEIHIVWSEHSRDYRRGIIPTEFGDVIIAIYPMLTFQGYYRIQISSKQDVPSFGPLFDNCIVHQTCLAPLVRATAINASRAKRLKLPYYQSHFEERYRLIETIVKNHKERLSFEEFAVQFFDRSESSSKNSPQVSASTPATVPSDDLSFT